MEVRLGEKKCALLSFGTTFQMLTCNLATGSPPPMPPDVLGHLYGSGGAGGLGSVSGSPLHYQSPYAYDNSAFGPGSPPPRRRYSFGGLPTMAAGDYYSLPTMQGSGLCSDPWTRPLSRSSSLTRRFSFGGGSYPTLYGRGIEQPQPTWSDNPLAMSSNFYSHPNIYSTPTYGGLFDTHAHPAPQFGNRKPSPSYLYSRPIYSNPQPPPSYSAGGPSSSYPHTSSPHHAGILSSTSPSRHHYASYPALSRSPPTAPHYSYSASHLTHPSTYPLHTYHPAHHHPYTDRGGEAKRQVSFKFDVDTLSIDS